MIDGVRPGGVWLLRVLPPVGPPFLDLVAIRNAPDERVDLGWRELAPRRYAYGRIMDPLLRPIENARLRPAPRRFGAPAELGVAGELLASATDPMAETDALVAVSGPRGTTVFELPPWFASLRGAIDPATVRTDSRGRFSWQAVGAADATVVVEADGFAPAVVELTLGFDGQDRGDVVLEPLPRTEITVVDELDRPVAGAEVALGAAVIGRASVPLERVGRTDGSGRLSVPFAEVPILVAVRPSPDEPFFATSLPADLEQLVRLPATHRVVFRCVDPAGSVVDGAEIRLVRGEPLDEQGPGTLALHQLGAIDVLDPGERVDRPVPGEIVVDGVRDGAWIALVTASDRVPAAVPVVVSGPTEVHVELRPTEPLRVTVVDQGFALMRGATVVASFLGGGTSAEPLGTVFGRCDAAAALGLERDPGSPTRLAIAVPGLGWRFAEIDPGTRDGQLMLRQQGALAGALVSAADGFDPRRWLVVAHRVREPLDVLPVPPVLVAPQPDGTVEVGDLEPGLYSIEARPMPAAIHDFGALLDLLFETGVPDDRPRVLLDVAPGLATGFRLDPVPPAAPAAEAPRRFEGRLLVDGEPPGGGALLVVRDGQQLRVPLDDSGAFDAGEWRAGPVELALVVPGLNAPAELWRARLELGTDPSPIEVDVRTEPISAQLTTASGRRAGGVEVRLEGETATAPVGRVVTSLRADASGFVAMDHLPNGSYVLTVTDPERGWLRMRHFAVGPTRVTTGASFALNPLLRMAGDIDERAIGIDVPRTSELDFERVEPDGVSVKHTAVCGEGGDFLAEGLLPGRYRVTLRAARRIQRADGSSVLVTPSASGIVVPLGDVDVPEHDVAGAVLGSRR